MRDDIEIPFLEVGDLVLRFAYDDLDYGLFEPLGLGFERLGFPYQRRAGGILGGCGGFRSLCC
jgi:hypothetical protein